ncbi:MAG: hypothetical protein WBO55_04555 [Rhizobiaceae bacterium]
MPDNDQTSSKAEQQSGQQVRSRLVLNFPGFEQTDSLAQIGRLHYCGDNTGKIWGFTVDGEEPVHKDVTHYTEAQFTAKGQNWHTAMRLVQFRWNDIVHAYERGSFPQAFVKNFVKYMAFIGDGTVRRYRKASWRYWGFTIYPILLAALAAIPVWLGVGYVIGALGLDETVGVALHVLLVTALVILLCKWPGDRLYVPLTIADWGFARDMVNRENPEIEARFEEFGRKVAQAIAGSSEDEIIIVGHSFGSLWAVSALALALEAQPDLLARRKVTFLALGSSMLKIALAPRAKHIMERWRKVMAQENLFWHEVQTKDDLIAFYRCDPFEQAGIRDPRARYHITRIRFSKGMISKRYRAMRKSFYTTHRQYILYYDMRVHFDYMLRLFGPFSAKSLALDEELSNRIDKKGALR